MHTVLRHHVFLRGLPHAQRRRWFEQYQSQKPRASIGTLHLAPAIRHSFAYMVQQ